jgi:Domain of unknown function (DUF3291).
VSFYLAQVNIALPAEPLDSPALAEFVARLEPVNAAADAAPGFVWRWVRAGHLPSMEEAEEHLGALRARGPSPSAFTFREHFPAPDSRRSTPTRDKRRLCPAG